MDRMKICLSLIAFSVSVVGAIDLPCDVVDTLFGEVNYATTSNNMGYGIEYGSINQKNIIIKPFDHTKGDCAKVKL